MEIKNESKKIFFFVLPITQLLFSCCTPTEPPTPPREEPKKIELENKYVSCTEAFIEISVADSLLPLSVTLTKDTKEYKTVYLTKPDTVIIDTTLEPNKIYTYQAETEIEAKEESSKELELKTLEITSSNYKWEKYSFGGILGKGTSMLNDIVIIDENNIWAVGSNINTDTSDLSYNAAHWNGNKWELKRIMFYIDPDQPQAGKIPSVSETAVFLGNELLAISSNVQVAIFYKDTTYNLLKMGFIWEERFGIVNNFGKSKTDFYFVGLNGSIAHYKEGNWIKLKSGTSSHLGGIYGAVNPITEKEEVLTCGHLNGESVLIRIKEDETTELLETSGLSHSMSLWFIPGIMYYIVGSGLFEKSYSKEKWIDNNKGRIITNNFMRDISGTGPNNIFVVGNSGEIIHYNGKEWQSIKDETTSLDGGGYESVSVKGDIVAAAGLEGRKGVILLGRKQ